MSRTQEERDAIAADLWELLRTRGLTIGHVAASFVAEISSRDDVHPSAIVDEIALLEAHPSCSPTGTKRAALFNRKGRKELDGLWHKHYKKFSVGSMSKNLQRRWSGKRASELGHLVRRLLPPGGVVTLQHLSAVTRAFTDEGYKSMARDNLLTGEWIVFVKMKGENYYLTLGEHADDWGEIARRARSAASEFPGLVW